MKTLAFSVIDRLVLRVHGAVSPSDAEWHEYLEFRRRHGIDRTAEVVWTAGGGPTPAQRRALQELVGVRTVPMAVISPAWRVRGGVTVLSLFIPSMKAFTPRRLREAIVFLEVPASRATLIADELARLELGLRA